MKKRIVFVIDTEDAFRKLINDTCPVHQIEARFYSSPLEIIALLGKEDPAAIIINLETPGMNDFVMHDILKKTQTSDIPVFITYLRQSEKDLNNYQKLKYKAKDIFQKPISKDQLELLFSEIISALPLSPDIDEEPEKTPIEPIEPIEQLNEQIDERIDASIDENLDIDGDQFSDANIDKLIAGELLPTDTKTTIPQNDKKRSTPPENSALKALEIQIISLENQNEFLRTENKTLSTSLEALNGNVERSESKLHQLESELEQKAFQYEDLRKKTESQRKDLEQKIEILERNSEQLESSNSDLMRKFRDLNIQYEKVKDEKFDLQKEAESISNRLTDKERELVAMNHKFEVELQKKLNETLQETEERLLSEFKYKETRLNHDLSQIQNEKKELEVELLSKIEELTQLTQQLKLEKQELKNREDTLERTVSALAEEKVAISEKMVALEETLSRCKNQMTENDTTFQTTSDNLKKKLDETTIRLDYHKKRLAELSDILQRAIVLTDIENQNHLKL
ncbi:MAG: hypothetical protein ACM3SY_01370 [Candidatus Omnitrophota bacterium]